MENNEQVPEGMKPIGDEISKEVRNFFIDLRAELARFDESLLTRINEEDLGELHSTLDKLKKTLRKIQ